MICPKCGCTCIRVESASVASLGMGTIKGTLKASDWAFKVVSKLTENFGRSGMLASMATRGVAGLINEGAEKS